METSRALASTRVIARQPTTPGAAAEDPAALYDAYAGPLYRYLLALLQNTVEAEDALAEVFLGLLRRTGRRAIEDAHAYVFRAARNQAIQVLRRRRRRGEEPLSGSWIALEECRGAEREIAIDIGRALHNLPAEHREALVLKLSEGLTFREMAAVLGIPANTAASRYRLALKRLRAELTGGDDHA